MLHRTAIGFLSQTVFLYEKPLNTAGATYRQLNFFYCQKAEVSLVSFRQSLQKCSESTRLASTRPFSRAPRCLKMSSFNGDPREPPKHDSFDRLCLQPGRSDSSSFPKHLPLPSTAPRRSAAPRLPRAVVSTALAAALASALRPSALLAAAPATEVEEPAAQAEEEQAPDTVEIPLQKCGPAYCATYRCVRRGGLLCNAHLVPCSPSSLGVSFPLKRPGATFPAIEGFHAPTSPLVLSGRWRGVVAVASVRKSVAFWTSSVQDDGGGGAHRAKPIRPAGNTAPAARRRS